MTTRALSRARVTDLLNGERVQVELSHPPGQRVEAALAFTFPYAPRLGDRLLILSTPDGARAIGLLEGHGRSRLAFPGDVELRCAAGGLRLEAEESLELEAPRVTLGASRLQTTVDTLRLRADEAYRWVQRALDVRARECRRAVAGEDYAQSENATLLGRDAVKIDGNTVQLG
jgi:hypothetical protein